MPDVTRRNLLRGGAGLTGLLAVGGVAACSRDTAGTPTGRADVQAEAARKTAGRALVSARLTAGPADIDLGGRHVATWTFGDAVPGPLLRATAGDLLRVDVANQLPADTSVHFHGVALRNDMDGVPGVTQDPIRPGSDFRYEFTAPDPGTYFYHPHVGVQLDRGLYGVLVVDDPAEPGAYDEEWVVVLDDWVDGTGRTPDQVLAGLRRASGKGDAHSMHDMGSMMGMPGNGAMGGMEGMDGRMSLPLLGSAGDVGYPHYLVNGRTPDAPVTLRGKAGQRVRIRFVNAGADTAFRVAIGGHRITVTHTDGFPVAPVSTDALLIGMGERYDVNVDLSDGVFPLVALAEGKRGHAMAVVRTGSGTPPTADARPEQLTGRVLLGTDLRAQRAVRLEPRSVDRTHDLVLSGGMTPYRWTINGRTYPDSTPLPVRQGERVRLRILNMSMMFHPMHVHGHTFALVHGGVRKDTVIVRPMQTLWVDLEADNPGQWAAHCHNAYHAEAGMMTTLSYRG